ncbi:amidase family protein [uncultured Corynebacterium sp.]|uniref:amidase family protein n=1 Tax=uncultured Corynebacterium sp. TaxID=159447 RepID=UPI0025E0D645|nr:amidase family protein [uncultured Corynebacterium sp.]
MAAIAVFIVTLASLLGLYALTRKRRGRPWGKLVPALLVVVALVAGVVGGGVRVLQQVSGLQRGEGKVVALDENTNHFPRQIEVDTAAFDQLVDEVGEDRLREMKERFTGADMISRHRLRVEHGYTAGDMLAYYVWRMKGGAEGTDRPNSYFRAVMELDPGAVAAAKKAGDPDPDDPMHGAVVLVKGNIAVDGLVNDSGSWSLSDALAGADSDVVRNLRDRGAVIAGRTNLSEFANFLTVGGPNGFSGRGGQALSPQGPLTVDPLGSSTGSATAIALDYADVTVGTETSGSVLAPAGAAGVVGLKTAHDGCSISGIVPIDDRVDSVGFLGRSTRDVRAAERAGCAAEPASTGDAADAPAKVMVLGDVPQTLRDRAASAGVEVVEAPEKIRDLASELESVDSESILLGGFGPSLAAHLKDTAGSARTIDDVAKYYEEHGDTAPYGFTTLRRAADIDPDARAHGKSELDRAKKLVADVEAVMSAAGVDALVTSETDLAFFSLAGVPRISVPLGKKPADDVAGKESPELAFQVTAARGDALPQVLAIAEALDPAL